MLAILSFSLRGLGIELMSCVLLSHSANPVWLPQATVGAGLPIMSTLRSLIETGDRVINVEGILSGAGSRCTRGVIEVCEWKIWLR